MEFKVSAKDGAARRGTLKLAHGVVETPAFMPVGTYGTVKGVLPQSLHEHLQAVGAQYYAFHSDSLPGGKDIPTGHVLARLVTSFATTDADIEAFAAHAKGTR